MKISVSLPEADVAFLDEYGAETSADSRSAVIHAAIELLRAARLEDDYQQAWQEWGQDESTAAWDGAMGDGLADASR
ncbi:ribbon-helix-helix domain-containing protein [Streptomyces sp. B1866]|uniref:ribbon-helix-helix domain-containing protein n=1 Tax=Streptomyces sp. B1866 TaxID=3075431 RepID=UPI0028900285|nr:ribbon-helix-helix domain-containing protein [Streptomyces sp. B1866]MDT3397146.1 ribbon-helix-helix domain-containing protein [Streptomyces sp. B1866]